jgi:hypothetical protein
MALPKQALKEAGIAVSIAVAVCALIADLFASAGLAAILGDAQKIVKPGEAGLPEYLEFGQIFLRTAPVVLAVIASGLLLMYSEAWHWGMLIYLTAIWFVAGNISYWGWARADANAMWLQTSTIHFSGPFAPFLRTVAWVLLPYGGLLAAQGVAIGAVAVGYLLYLKEKSKAA